jgi:predicted TIM-barrel fold metal-dependent hydrolase
MDAPHLLSRRSFITTSALALASARQVLGAVTFEPVIDIHQHTNYGGGPNRAPRTHDQLVAHQRAMGITTSILLPAGRPVKRASTHDGTSNGLNGTCTTNEDCMMLATKYPKEFLFGANEVTDLDDAPAVIEKYLKLGAVIIGEQKFGVQCDSAESQKLYKLAEAYNVPILMHWQHGRYNHGFDRFHTMLKKYPKTNFIGHAQTWWANIDKAYKDDAKNLYPKSKVTPGGLTDRYLRDYPNMYADLSAGSGFNAFERYPDGKSFIERHQDKLLYGSDCSDLMGRGGSCSGAMQLAQMRAMAPSKAVERKILYENARKLFRLA